MFRPVLYDPMLRRRDRSGAGANEFEVVGKEHNDFIRRLNGRTPVIGRKREKGG